MAFRRPVVSMDPAIWAGSASARRRASYHNLQSGFVSNRSWKRSFSDPFAGEYQRYRRELALIRDTSRIATDQIINGNIRGSLRMVLAESHANAKYRMAGARTIGSANSVIAKAQLKNFAGRHAGAIAVVGGGAVAGGTAFAGEQALKYHRAHQNKGNHHAARKIPTTQMHGRRNVRTRRDSKGRYAGSY